MTHARATAFRAAWSWRLALPYVLGIGCLVWLFHDLPIQPLVRSMTHLKLRWVAIAIGFDIASYACQGYRWKLLLQSLGELTWFRSTRFVYAGLFASEILPLRAGEAVRAYLAAQSLKVPFPAILPSIFVERLFDGIWLTTGLAITMMLVPLPDDLRTIAQTSGVVILLATAVFLVIALRRQTDTIVRDRVCGVPIAPLGRFWAELTKGLRQIGCTSRTAAAFALTLPQLSGQAMAFCLVLRAYGVPVGWWPGVATLLVVQLGTALPNAPANIGTYQLACVAGLTLFGIDKATAAGFSLVVFAVLTIPLWILGLAATGLRETPSRLFRKAGASETTRLARVS